MTDFIHRYFSVILLGAVATGVYFQQLGDIFGDHILTLIMVILFFNFLKVDVDVFKAEWASWPYQMYLIALRMVIVPAVIYWGCLGVLKLAGADSTLALGPLVLFATPTAAMVPTFLLLTGGFFERGIISLALSSLVAPVVFPAVVLGLAGQSVEIPFWSMMILLAKVIFIPFCAAILVRKGARQVYRRILPYVSTLSVLVLIPVIFGATAGLKQYLQRHLIEVSWLLALAVGCFCVAYALGWLLSIKQDVRSRYTAATISVWTNISVSIGIASAFFKESFPWVMVFVVLCEIPWNSWAVVAHAVSKRAGLAH